MYAVLSRNSDEMYACAPDTIRVVDPQTGNHRTLDLLLIAHTKSATHYFYGAVAGDYSDFRPPACIDLS